MFGQKMEFCEMTKIANTYNPYVVESVMELVHDEMCSLEGVELVETLSEIRTRVDAQIAALIEHYK